jgi:hypothetical protein
MPSDRRKAKDKDVVSSPANYYVRLGHDLLDSDAWLHLSPHAFKLLVAIWRRHNGRNNGQIPFSRDEACEVLGCHTRVVSRAFTELQDKGFLRLRRDSHFNQKCTTAREWEITAEPMGSGLPAADFKGWSAGD